MERRNLALLCAGVLCFWLFALAVGTAQGAGLRVAIGGTGPAVQADAPAVLTAAPANSGLQLECRAAILMEPETGRVLYEKAPDERMPIASITKLMTLLLTFDEEIYLRIGSDETLLPLCVEYGRIMVLAGPIWSLQILFQGFLVTADRPHMGLWLSVAAGCVNIGLDLLLVGVFDFGLAGAGYASMAGMFVGGLVPLRVFFDKKSLLHFEKPIWKGKELLLAMGNGASEMVTSLSSAITTALFNLQMMAIVGEKGVAAISAILYLQFVFVALLIGFTSGVAPIFSYNYGAGNRANIHKLFAISARMVLSFSLAMLVVAELLDRPMVLIFASKDPVLRDLMIVGFRIIAISVFFTGINIFASGFFTAMNNGRVSALVSILRTLVLEVGALLLMPMWWGINGVWWALPVAEILASLVAVSMLLRYRKTYGY